VASPFSEFQHLRTAWFRWEPRKNILGFLLTSKLGRLAHDAPTTQFQYL